MISNLALPLVALGLTALASAQQVGQAGGHAAVAPVPRRNCAFTGASHSMSFVPGANAINTFVTTADPELRKFIVYVPSTYSWLHAPYPVVYMFHGTGQSAQIAINKTTWNHAAEVGDFIAVYPEALPYLLLDGTVRTKWRTDAVEDFVVDPSELPMADDTLFVRELQNTLIMHLNVDCERVYASGFSNGGGFVKTELRVDLADIFAATTSAGGIGASGGVASDYFPANGVDFRPHFEIVGTKDDKKIANCVAAGDLAPGDILPRHVVDIVATPCMWDPLTLFAEGVGLDPAIYATIENASFTQFLWSTVVMPGPGPTEYRFRVLPNLTHEYPSGTNYPTDYVPLFWFWMSQYTR
jgi:poly(3-hydroxybutyrate) depolymerase